MNKCWNIPAWKETWKFNPLLSFHWVEKYLFSQTVKENNVFFIFFSTQTEDINVNGSIMKGQVCNTRNNYADSIWFQILVKQHITKELSRDIMSSVILNTLVFLYRRNITGIKKTNRNYILHINISDETKALLISLCT